MHEPPFAFPLWARGYSLPRGTGTGDSKGAHACATSIPFARSSHRCSCRLEGLTCNVHTASRPALPFSVARQSRMLAHALATHRAPLREALEPSPAPMRDADAAASAGAEEPLPEEEIEVSPAATAAVDVAAGDEEEEAPAEIELEVGGGGASRAAADGTADATTLLAKCRALIEEARSEAAHWHVVAGLGGGVGASERTAAGDGEAAARALLGETPSDSEPSAATLPQKQQPRSTPSPHAMA